MEYLSVEDLLEVAAGVISTASGTTGSVEAVADAGVSRDVAGRTAQGVQVRDLGLLASAAARPRTTVLGEDAYPTLAAKAAALLHSLARNHPLVDGNKRLAWAGARVMCLLNGADVVMDVDDAERMVLAAAAGELDAAALAVVIERHLR